MDDAYRDHLLEGQRAGARYAMDVPRLAPAGMAGAHLANRPGSSLEFMDHRAYQPGDDLRRIDWSAYARTDKLTVKIYRHEVNPHVDVLVDGSRSMALQGTAKARATVALAALVATAAQNSRFSHRVHLAAQQWVTVPDSTGDPAGWGPIGFDSVTDPASLLAAFPPTLAPRGIRVLVADLLWLGDPEPTLARLADRAAGLAVVQVLARADVAPPRFGSLRLLDCETREEREVFVDARAAERYRDRLARHQQHWHRAARQVGAVMTTVVAEDLLRSWDLEGLVAAGVLKVNLR